ncbi:hypothetical protein [uncultured Ferrimonas sp.]|uniref:hypothetical protein n=1 Tax=uncultured Ferrimonas sp. TaxID=432640 RepID=UPI00261E860D|nr:hypothetical protein [uncultured Ferrimonas sp.]
MPKIVITPESVKTVVRLIDTWDGKLTWKALCGKVAEVLDIDNVERQTLASYQAIQDAYSQRKIALREAPKEPAVVFNDSTAEYLHKRVVELEAEVKRVNELNERYKQRFVLWQHNAYLNGVRVDRLDDVVDVLNKPMTTPDRRGNKS